MKKQVEAFIKSLGGSPSYSGKSKIMYVSGTYAQEIISRVTEKYPSLPFKLEVQ